MFDLSNNSAEQEKDGVWASFAGGEFKIAHTNNIAFQRVFAKLQQPFRKKIERGTLDPKIQLDIMCQALGKTVLVDWKNVGEGDNEVEYSPEASHKALMASSDLREYVQEFATNLENYRDEDIEEQVKE